MSESALNGALTKLGKCTRLYSGGYKTETTTATLEADYSHYRYIMITNGDSSGNVMFYAPVIVPVVLLIASTNKEIRYRYSTAYGVDVKFTSYTSISYDSNAGEYNTYFQIWGIE